MRVELETTVVAEAVTTVTVDVTKTFHVEYTEQEMQEVERALFNRVQAKGADKPAFDVWLGSSQALCKAGVAHLPSF